MVIQHNITALNAYNKWVGHNNRMSKSLARLSSGYRINSAADDPAGLAISESMKAQIRMLKRQKMNALDAVSSVQISESIQSEVSGMLQRMQDLAAESMNGVLQDADREKLNEEYQQLIQEIDRVNSASQNSPVSLFGKSGALGTQDGEKIVFEGGNLDAYLDALDAFLNDVSAAARDGNTLKLAELGVEGDGSNQEKLQKALLEFTKKNGQELLSTPGGSGQKASIILSGGDIRVNLLYSDTEDLGLRGTNISDAANAGQALDAVKNASSIVIKQRAHYGAVSNRLEHTVSFIDTMLENLESAVSRIVDADMAKEMMEFVRSKAMAQAAMFVMTYASHEPEQILQLLRS